jgi:hypothetical protein
MKTQVIKAYLQIFLVVCAVFAFSYILDSAHLTRVSALEEIDLERGVSTCLSGDEGLCTEYPNSECQDHCDSDCIPTSIDGVSACELGTCFDPIEGICQPNSPKQKCLDSGGQFVDENDPICRQACCKIGNGVEALVTETQCNRFGEVEGVQTEYLPGVRNEISCLLLANTNEDGACIFDLAEGRSCIHQTKEYCISRGGEFNGGLLCTHPDLEMGYEKQASTKCFEDKVYWYDSEGNRENIYDANRVESWNNGELLATSESCELGNSRDYLANQDTCGNCNRFAGSACGQRTANEKLSDGDQDFVCRDLGCVDSYGNDRKNGESWCEYQGAFGIKEGSGITGGEKIEDSLGHYRAVDTPGSRHFRASCFDGEVSVNACDAYRNKVCVEERSKGDTSEDISSAGCVLNVWQLCLDYNTQVESEDLDEKVSQLEERNEDCLANPQCFLKNVSISENFNFAICSPKYSPSFDLQENPAGGEMICGSASQKCTVTWVKKISGWKPAINAGCLEPKFAEQMNDMCMSLGDCGASVNYQGDLTENYRVVNSPELGKEYIEGISDYHEPIEGEFVEINSSQYLEVIGGRHLQGFGEFVDQTPGGLVVLGGISGAMGAAMIYAPQFFTFSSSNIRTTTISSGGANAVVLSSYGIALAGAAVGFAITSMLIKLTGIGAGLDPLVTYGLLSSGSTAGTLISPAGGSPVSSSSWTPVIGWAIVAVVVIVVIVLKILGVGKTREQIVSFECEPWQPPLGGAGCEKCGSDGYDCSKYSCQSLGQTCRLINEDTEEEKCVDISPSDVTSPVISPSQEALSDGFSYESESGGVKVVSESDDGCIKADDTLIFGISVNEPARCVYDFEHTNNFNDMGRDFGDRSLFLEEHSQVFSGFDLRELGEFDLSEYDPNSREDVNFHVRCIDGNGNGKDSAEYVINFCVKPGEDVRSPGITLREPAREEILFNASSISASVYVTEPADCRWSLDSSEGYSEMTNNFNCANAVGERIIPWGWRCGTVFPIEKNEEKFYVQCLDQPWLNDSQLGERNEMNNAYEFILRRTNTPLVIESVTPFEASLEFGVEPATVDFVVETSGGADDGRATCYLLGDEMDLTFQTVHKDSFNQIFSGNYNIPVMCEDFVGNVATAASVFEVSLDVDSPKVTRVYDQGGNLVVVTDERGKCSFVKEEGSCSFDFNNGTLMTGTGVVHSTIFDGTTHYVKCNDKFDNVPGSCSVVVKGGGL